MKHLHFLGNGSASIILRLSLLPPLSLPPLHTPPAYLHTYPAPSGALSPSSYLFLLLSTSFNTVTRNNRINRKMRKMPLVAKLGENVEIAIHRSPATTTTASRVPAASSSSPWHLPYWSGEYGVVVSPPWLLALAMIALGLTILVVSACRTLGRKRKSVALGERRRRMKARLDDRHPPVMAPACNVV